MARKQGSRSYGHYRSSTYGTGKSDGYERARQHIEDAKRLSQELGGTDVDVKEYFFSLPANQLNNILIEYGERFGAQPEDYARNTMLQWKSGAVKMSGTVAERLFKLLPPRMPIAEKYKLTESLWSHFGPRSKKILRIGLNADIEIAFSEIHKHIKNVVEAHKIPKEMEARFEWLAAGDVNVKQLLLNKLREAEKRLVSEGAKLQLPVMIEHLKSSAGVLTHRMAQTLIIGNHELELLIDREFEGVALEDWKPLALPPKSVDSNKSWIIWLIVAVVFIMWLRH